MTITDPLRKLARAQYSLVTAPVRALEGAVARLFRPDAAVRVTLERQVDALDATVERLLGTTEQSSPSAPSGRVVAARPDARVETELPDDDNGKEAAQNEHDEQDDPSDHAVDPSEVVGSVPVEERNRLAEELLEELDQTPLVGELDEAPEDAKQDMADLRAKHLTEEFEIEQARRARSQDS
jgi:hypothetical protein